MIKTKVTEMLGIKYPIIQGAMLWLSRADFVAAVCNAGGLGILSALSFPDKYEFREEVRKTKYLTENPFAVNMVYLPMERESSNEDFLEIIIEEDVKVVETVGAVPPDVYKKFKQAGVICIHKATSVKHAMSAEAKGVEAVCVEGVECAGHPGMENISSLVLLQRTLESLKVPVIAAGGFGDGKGLAAALALGAEGVLMGTRFLVTKECPAHPKIKEWCLKANETDTVLALRSLRDPVRYMKTDLAEQVLGMETSGAGLKELLPIISGLNNKRALEIGDLTVGICSCGQSVGLVHDIPSVEELITRIMDEADQSLKRLKRLNQES